MAPRRHLVSPAGKLLRQCSLALALLLLLPDARQANGGTVAHEPELKAGFLCNFSHFTDWPAETFADEETPMVIGVLGRDPFGSILDEAVRGEHVNQRPLVVIRFKRVEDIKACQVLFIGDSETKRLPAILAKLAGRSILTVSDMDGFTSQGGMVRYLTSTNGVQLEVNLEAVKAAKLLMSSKLLRTAEIVSTKKK